MLLLVLVMQYIATLPEAKQSKVREKLLVRHLPGLPPPSPRSYAPALPQYTHPATGLQVWPEGSAILWQIPSWGVERWCSETCQGNRSVNAHIPHIHIHKHFVAIASILQQSSNEKVYLTCRIMNFNISSLSLYLSIMIKLWLSAFCRH